MKKRTLRESDIGYYDPDDPRPVYGWNTGGFGCSMGCDGCWSRALAKRLAQCPDCKAFRVHFHPERLCEPANKKTPGIVLCNFTNDWMDALRPEADIERIQTAIDDAPHHVYVTLTKQASRLKSFIHRANANIYDGLTIRTQAEADAMLPKFLTIPGKLWLSLEPLWGKVEIGSHGGGTSENIIAGAIVGHDNRYGEPCTYTLDYIRDVVHQCKLAGIRVYVKQIWQYVGDRPKLLRASHPDEYALYPDYLRVVPRKLPWSKP